MHILYLTHDLTDPTTTKRVRMLLAGGATVTIGGFSRRTPPAQIEGCHVLDLGTTHSGRFLARTLSVLTTRFQFGRHRAKLIGVDLILTRNLEMLAIATKAQKLHPTPIAYEVLDIHRLLAGTGVVSTYLQWVERWLCRRVSVILTSSPAFISEYFERRNPLKLPMLLVENKVFGLTPPASISRPIGPPWRIGWFGALRCQQSLDLLCDLARANPGLVEISLRGRPAYDQIPAFDSLVASTPGLTYHGPYENPDDLAAIYGDVHFSWAIDLFEEGLNAAWLLPNRLYEGGLYGAVPLAAQGTQTSRFISNLGIGHILAEPKAASLNQWVQSLTSETYQQLASAAAKIPKEAWLASEKECITLVAQLGVYVEHTHTTDAIDRLRISPATPALVVIPCLNEHATIVTLVKQLAAESAARPMTIVIADGGSTDGTVELAKKLVENYPNVRYLHNRKRIQSAAINLAVATYSQGHGYLIRMDAHAKYQAGYCATLITEANRVAADAVVVSMRTTGTSRFQQAVAAAQNSCLGNGGAQHRNVVDEGQWVDHGHHALMRIDAFRAIGGYDESFTHNEDAELDIRLTRTGRHIWLTSRATLDYIPRSGALSLFRQYHHYGKGRARTLRKHHLRPKLRQLLPVAVLPAFLLFFATGYFGSIAVFPLLAWAAFCLVYGFLIGIQSKSLKLALSGPAAMLMHSGWSLGFWQGIVLPKRKPA